MAVTISIVIACSQQYAHHLDDYMNAVAQLDRQPDEIVLVTDKVQPTFNCVRVQAPDRWNLGEWYNLGFDAASSDWIVWTGADDRLRPHALNTIDTTNADVIAFGLHYTTGQTWMPANIRNADILKVQHNLVTCGSPVRKQLWQATAFEPDLAPFEDWAFWVGCAHNNAQFTSTRTLDVDYTYGSDHIAPAEEPTRTRIQQWLKGLS